MFRAGDSSPPADRQIDPKPAAQIPFVIAHRTVGGIECVQRAAGPGIEPVRRPVTTRTNALLRNRTQNPYTIAATDDEPVERLRPFIHAFGYT